LACELEFRFRASTILSRGAHFCEKMTATYQRLLNALTPLLIAFGLSTVCGYADEYNWGRFEGKIVARFLDDGRHMRIKEAFKYIDRHEVSWDVPAERSFMIAIVS
jgi:hypothetical protein